MAVSYDLVLEDRILAHQAAKRRTRPFAREVAEMVRYAVGYQSRAFVDLRRADPAERLRRRIAPRRDGARAPHARHASARLYKVLPTAVVAAAMRPVDDAARARGPAPRRSIDDARGGRRQPGVTVGRDRPSNEAAEPLEARGIIHVERGGRFRVRERTVLRYYARTLQHLLVRHRPYAPHALMLDSRLESILPALAASERLKSLASRYGTADGPQLRAPVHRRRNRRRGHRRGARASRRRA